MKIYFTLFVLFIPIYLSAQDTIYIQPIRSEKEIGIFSGIGQTFNKENHADRKSYLGSDLGIMFSRKSIIRNRRLELSLSHSVYQYSYSYDKVLPATDTSYQRRIKMSFLDLTLKSNLGLVNRPKFDWYFVMGISGGLEGKVSKIKETSSLKSSGAPILEGGFQTKKADYRELYVGLQIGFLFHFNLKNNLALTFEPLLMSKVSADLIYYDGPYKFRQMRFGLRKVF